jgi:GNAT superfamily N-acetyltransferase
MEVGSHQPRSGHVDRPQPPVPHVGSLAEVISWQLVPGHAGDHALVHALLRAVNQAPSYDDFVTWLDEPTYEPSDRLLVKHGNQIVAHLQVLHRTAWFEDVRLPVGSAQDLAVLPEYSDAGYDRQLIAAAERAMRDSQAIVSLIRAPRPEPFHAAGWTDVRAGGYSQANVGDILAHLSVHAPPRHRRTRALRIRRWRHVEMDATRAVYSASAANHWGAIYRAEPYWQWIVGRKAHTDVIVAVEGPDEWDDLSTEPAIVGYAVTAGAQVLELCCLPEFARAAPRLLVRACQDAIERDHHTLSLHTAASDPLHELMVTAGGTWCTDDRHSGGTLQVKLLNGPRWIEAVYPILRRRAKGAGLPRPLAICFDTGDEHYRLVLTRRSSRLVADEEAAADVHCDAATFSALLVGNLNVARARDECRLDVADDDVLHKLAVLFPPSLFWQSQFDTLRF